MRQLHDSSSRATARCDAALNRNAVVPVLMTLASHGARYTETIYLFPESRFPGSALEQLATTAVRFSLAVGPMAGRETTTLHNPDAVSGEHLSIKPLSAARDTFSIHAAVVYEAHQRNELERLCRYVSSGPITLDRLSIGRGNRIDRGRRMTRQMRFAWLTASYGGPYASPSSGLLPVGSERVMRPLGEDASRTHELTPIVVGLRPGPGKPGSARAVQRRVFAMLHCVPLEALRQQPRTGTAFLED